ncbi:MAG: ABC transporter permease [Breznakibacter sp.]
MKTIFFLIQKEFLQIFRNKILLRLMLVIPIVQLIILVNAATQDMKDNRIIMVDQDRTAMSQKLIDKFNASPFFDVVEVTPDLPPALERFRKERIDAVLVIPPKAEKQLLKEGTTSVQLIANAVNSTRAQLTHSYVLSIMQDYNVSVLMEQTYESLPAQIVPTWRYWFNTELDYRFFMLPGILVILVTIIGMFMAAINLVREKEMGTLEQMNVTPVKKYQFIAAKLVPFWFIGLFELALGLIIGKLLYHIPIEGSLWVLFGFAGVYLVGMLGLGLFISTTAQSQQQVVFASYFFLMVFIMMSGLFTAAENMPKWGQILNQINPIYYFIEAMRRILLKGSGFTDIMPLFAGVLGIAVVMLPLAVRNYKKRI